MLKTKSELKSINPLHKGIPLNTIQKGLEVHLDPVSTKIMPQTLNELEYGLKKNQKNLIGGNILTNQISELASNYDCNYILDPRYLTEEEKTKGAFRVNSGVQDNYK